MKKIITILSITLSLQGFSQTVLLDEDFSTGIPSNWTIINADGNIPAVALYSDAWVGFTSVFDTCVASTSYYVDSNGDDDTLATSSDYLITPQLSLLTFGNILTWDAKSLDGSFPDNYIVLVSTTDNLEGSFTDTIKTITEETPYWTNYSINLVENGYVNQDVYIAFKNTTTNGFVLQLDNIKVTADDPASIDNNLIDNKITVYPNPFMDELNIEATNLTDVRIYNLLGELILKSKNNKINTSSFIKGQYVVVVKTQDSISNYKLIK